MGTKSVPGTRPTLAISLFLELCPVTGQTQILLERRFLEAALECAASKGSPQHWCLGKSTFRSH
jgi:hypothetical protein